jgi:acetyl-CoA synthetase
MSYGELEALTNRVANGIAEAGIRPGSAIAVCMPMTRESVAIYLGIIRAGCVVVSIADSFAPKEIRRRLEIAGAKAAFTQDLILRADKEIPLYQRMVDAGAPMTVVLPSLHAVRCELRECDASWQEFLSQNEAFESIIAQPDDATNILFSSGTTGDPKAIPWTHVTPIKCAADAYFHHDIQPGDRAAWPTNLGWMMGPWLIYASLINRATVALYDGVPTGTGFGRFVQDAGVTLLGVVPSLVRAWRDSGCMSGLDWTAIKRFSSTGECSNVEDMLFLMALAGYRPIIEYCGGTEIGGGYLTGTVIQPSSPATFSTAALGLDLVILDEQGRDAEQGEVFLSPPSIGLSQTLLNADHHEVYYAQTPSSEDGAAWRRHGDQLQRLAGGYFRALGRIDDTMNLGGIKVSSAEIERVVGAVEGVGESASIAMSPPGGGPSQLVIFVVRRPECRSSEGELRQLMQAAVREQLNPLFHVHEVVLVDSLPRTASNKVMRRLLRERCRPDTDR